MRARVVAQLFYKYKCIQMPTAIHLYTIVYIPPAFEFNGHLLMLPNECGYSLTIRNRAVAITR